MNTPKCERQRAKGTKNQSVKGYVPKSSSYESQENTW